MVYNYPGFACDKLPAGVVILDRQYQQDAADIVRERVLLAGVRLATLLDQTLAPADAARPRRL